jgi:Domain of Unknown Function (DUF928)
MKALVQSMSLSLMSLSLTSLSLTSLSLTSLSLTIALGSPPLSKTALAQSKPIQPQPSQIAQNSSGRVRFVPPPVPSGPAPGGNYRTGGKRTVQSIEACPNVSPDATALVPFIEKSRPGQDNLPPGQKPLPPITDVWGYTTATHPTVWFYMPYSAEQKIPVSFSLQQEDGKDDSSSVIYEQKQMLLPRKPGFIGIKIPATQPGLQIGTRYRWSLSIECKPPSASAASKNVLNLNGLIVRTSLDGAIAKQIAAASGADKAALYASNGIWFDALNTLAELRRKNPKDASLTADWQSLISSMNSSQGKALNQPNPFNPTLLFDQPFAP